MCILSTFVFVQVEHNTNTSFAPQRSVPIQAAEIEAPIIVQQTDANSKTLAVRRPSTPPPKPEKKNSMKTSDQTSVELQDAQVFLTDIDLHDEGKMTVQVLQQ